MKKTGRRVITLEMAAACYEQGKEVDKGNKTQTDAVKCIVKSTGMSKGSATIYTSIYRQMRDGSKVGYGMQVDHARYYFQHIYGDYGKSALRNALDAMHRWIDDYPQDLIDMQDAVDEYGGRRKGRMGYVEHREDNGTHQTCAA